MKTTKLYTLSVAFIFSTFNGMDQLFWLKKDKSKLISLPMEQAKKNVFLNYYIARFGYVNSKTSPLVIGSKKVLDALSSKKLKYAFEINRALPPDIDRYITHFLQRLNEYKSSSFVISCMLNHQMHSIDSYQKKTFFNNKEFYWNGEGECVYPVFYDYKDNEVFRIKPTDKAKHLNSSECFMPAYAGNSILFVQDGDNDKHKFITIYNLKTKEYVKMGGEFINFEISPHARYVALRDRLMRDDIFIYDISTMKEIFLISLVTHKNCGDFVFSPDDSKLVSWTNRMYDDHQIIVWDLTDIPNIIKNKKIFFSGEKCTQIIFNSDSEHICFMKSKNMYHIVGENAFEKSDIIIINSNDGIIKARLDDCSRLFIFPHNSDLIRYDGYDDNFEQIITKIVTKAGKQLHIPEYAKGFSYDNNDDYILAYRGMAAYLFDHNMNLIAQLSAANEHVKFTFDAENAIIETSMDGYVKKKNRWQLPKKKDLQRLQAINQNLTAVQYVFLETICLQKKDSLLNKDDILLKALYTFDKKHQEFLRQQLLITEQI